MRGINCVHQKSFATLKTKSGVLIKRTVKNNFDGRVQRFVESDNAFSFTSLVKRTPAHWKPFLYHELAVVKQLGIPTFFFIFSCADLRWEELPYIVTNETMTIIN